MVSVVIVVVAVRAVVIFHVAAGGFTLSQSLLSTSSQLPFLSICTCSVVVDSVIVFVIVTAAVVLALVSTTMTTLQLPVDHNSSITIVISNVNHIKKEDNNYDDGNNHNKANH